MEDLQLTINFQGEEIELPVRAYAYGYTYRLDVMVKKEVIAFEPDEEGSFRAFAGAQTDKLLIRAIAEELEKLR